MDYKVIRSNRKTVAIEVKNDGSVLVRAPQYMPVHDIERFVTEKADWIENAKRKAAKRRSEPELTAAELNRLADMAVKYIPKRVAYYARILGVTYGRITVRHQKTRWGSCSSKGNLNFNCVLMTMPERVIDYVVVHELCHRKQMNHSPAFWAEVARVLPDYKQLRAYLKTKSP